MGENKHFEGNYCRPKLYLLPSSSFCMKNTEDSQKLIGSENMPSAYRSPLRKLHRLESVFQMTGQANLRGQYRDTYDINSDVMVNIQAKFRITRGTKLIIQ